jgi:hypothetical protein
MVLHRNAFFAAPAALKTHPFSWLETGSSSPQDLCMLTRGFNPAAPVLNKTKSDAQQRILREVWWTSAT